MKRKFYCIFVAGGSGSRMGSEIPKQFLNLGGQTILQRTIDRFVEAAPDMHVITVLPESHFDTWKEICETGSLDIPQTLVRGGITRFHSVKNALEKVPDGVTVSIHDGVRPLLSVDLIRRMRARMEECPALIPVLPVVDTLRSKDPSEPSPDRSRILAVQTPQMFHSELIKKAYRLPYNTAFTDDASVAEAIKIPLSFIDGERCNIKITTPEDLRLSELFLSL
ncbi:MAG: 2-C-methyl-D-erythritol 4-phosphate cytidylyltransferase [Bacteroidales bacterium]|nr:2-C-methyl-D-erythritol 4-phosphate cytidylyltransferase [Bacteroidales bacterium]